MAPKNPISFGKGVYAPTEVASILQLPLEKVHRWINKYWDGILGTIYRRRYSYHQKHSKAIDFHTLVEFYVMMQLTDAGIKPKTILAAHQELSTLYQTSFPFAQKDILEGIKTDAIQIYFQFDDTIVSLDGSRQLNFEFIEIFFKQLDFDEQNLANRFWPLGRDNSVVVDPGRKLGQPILADTNIYPETIYNHYRAGDPITYIANVYGLQEKQVEDAIAYCNAA